MSDLLGKKHSIVEAEHTLRIATGAYKRGDMRLAVSRGITAIIQASIASLNAPEEIVERSEHVVQGVRRIIQGAVLSRALSGLGAKGFRFRLPAHLSPDPEVRKRTLPVHPEVQRARELMKTARPVIEAEIVEELMKNPPEFNPPRASASGLWPVTIPTESMDLELNQLMASGEIKDSMFIPSDTPRELWDFLTDHVPPVDVLMTGTGVIVKPRSKQFVTRILSGLVNTNPARAGQVMRPEFAATLMKEFSKEVSREFERRKREVMTLDPLVEKTWKTLEPIQDRMKTLVDEIRTLTREGRKVAASMKQKELDKLEEEFDELVQSLRKSE